MPYGEGRSKRELDRIARDYAKTDDNATYEVTTATGSRLTTTGINSAKALAGKDGSIKKK